MDGLHRFFIAIARVAVNEDGTAREGGRGRGRGGREEDRVLISIQCRVPYTVQLHSFVFEDCRKSHFNSIQDADLSVLHGFPVEDCRKTHFNSMRFCEVFGAAPRLLI